MTKDGGHAHSDPRRMLPARRPGPPPVWSKGSNAAIPSTRLVSPRAPSRKVARGLPPTPAVDGHVQSDSGAGRVRSRRHTPISSRPSAAPFHRPTTARSPWTRRCRRSRGTWMAARSTRRYSPRCYGPRTERAAPGRECPNQVAITRQLLGLNGHERAWFGPSQSRLVTVSEWEVVGEGGRWAPGSWSGGLDRKTVQRL